MPDNAPVGVATTVLTVVNATARVSFFSGGDKIGEFPVADGINAAPGNVTALRFGATEPGALNPASLVVQAIYSWTSALAENDALVVSGNLNYAPESGSAPLPILSVPANLSVLEGGILQIPVTKNGIGACSATIRTIASTTTINVDYTGFLQTINLAANDTILNVPLTTLSDTVADPGERLSVELSAPSGCTLGNAICTVTINELPRIAIASSVSVTEGAAASIIVTKTGTGACSVTYRTVGESATVDADYTRIDATTLTFAENDTQKIISIQTLTDTANETDETFRVVLENASNCTITTPNCIVTILDANSDEVPVATAYPTANGFATAANCGLGYPIYRVTNLNDTGVGSLRDACSAGNRLVVFEVGGVIPLGSILTIQVSNITIAGETAPAPGITVQKKHVQTKGSNIRISHITFQKGYDGTNLGDSDVFKVSPASAVVNPKIVNTNQHFYHCAFYWGMDETVQVWPSQYYALSNLSFHDCIFAEPLFHPPTYDSTLHNHEKVERGLQNQHNYGVLLGYNTFRADLQYCLFQDMDMREPFCDATTSIVLANLIANNTTKGATIQQNGPWSGTPDPLAYSITCKGYLCISGPNSGGSAYSGFVFQSYNNPQPANSKVYVTNLYGWKGGASNSTYLTPTTDVRYSKAEGAYWLSGTTRIPVRVSTPPIDTPVPTAALTAQEIFDRAVNNVGPRPKEIRNTAVPGNKDVRRTVDRLKNKTGKWVNHEGEYGGFYAHSRVDRKLDGTTKFPDNTTIPAPPTGASTPTATTIANHRAWLRKFLDQIQYD